MIFFVIFWGREGGRQRQTRLKLDCVNAAWKPCLLGHARKAGRKERCMGRSEAVEDSNRKSQHVSQIAYERDCVNAAWKLWSSWTPAGVEHVLQKAPGLVCLDILFSSEWWYKSDNSRPRVENSHSGWHESVDVIILVVALSRSTITQIKQLSTHVSVY